MMHCLAGAGHAVAGATGHAAQSLGEPEFDGAAFASGAFFSTRLNRVGQTFERRLAGIDYKASRQGLHREDIRDLVELTCKRMEIYHLVGTLLLAFVMAWYTDNTMWDLPVWFSDLFIISNYSAVGYLIMTVWNAMYASVAARAIGTRMLTSYARLSLPRQAELDAIKQAVFFDTTAAKDYISKKICRSKSEPNLPTEADEAQPLLSQVPEKEDHNQHFKRFCEELPAFLVHDIWSRICLAFGMNQLLQAMSYFSLATLWPKSPLIAIMSFVAINFLSHIILTFDTKDGTLSTNDELAVLLFHVLPSAAAVVLVIAQSMFPHIMVGERYIESVLVVMCFALHAGWLRYLVNLYDRDDFPGKKFASVLEWIPRENIQDKEVVIQRQKTLKIAGNADEAQESSPRLSARSIGSPRSAESTDTGAINDIKERIETNGGETPGVWRNSKRHFHETTFDNRSHKHLPVRLLHYFTNVTIAWWLVAGVTHSLIISFDRYNRFRDFTGSNNMAPLSKKFIQWPQPASLFKVAGLYCDNSQVLVNSGFSVYSMAEASGVSSGALNFIKEGNVGSVICGAHRCNTLSPPDGEGQWVLGPLQPQSGGETQVAIPHTWRQVAGVWMNCPASLDAACASAKIAGWDGARVFIASLGRSATDKAWRVHPQFQVDPVVGLCAEDPKACDGGPRTYNDVRALHMSESGRVLMLLLGSGAIDVWDLSEGIVAKRMQVGSNYTSMCQSGKDIYLSREDGDTPIMETTGLPPGIIELLQSPPSVSTAFNQRAATPSKLKQKQHDPHLQGFLHGAHLLGQ